MNKKNLSVVMAGAMLATSVAPVLAEEATDVKKYEVASNQLGLLMNGMRDKLNSKTFSKTYFAESYEGQSVYYFESSVKLTNDKGEELKAKTASRDVSFLKNVPVNAKITVWDAGSKTDEYGRTIGKEYFPTVYTADTIKSDAKAIKDDLENKTNIHKTIKSITVSDDNLSFTIVTYSGETITKTIGSPVVDFNKPLGAKGEVLNKDSESDIDLVKGYEYKTPVAAEKDITDTKIAEITVTNAAGMKVEDLYDGLMLTEKGHELLSSLKSGKAVDGRSYKVYLENGNDPVQKDGSNLTSDTFIIKYEDAFGNRVEYTIIGENKEDTKILATWLANEKARVDLLAGSDRYKTAATIAKEVAPITAANAGNDIVLVSGNSLVDGLAAAPLANALKVENGSGEVPILLTETNKLSTATKDYLKEIMANVPVGNLNTITINIVGGDAVVSPTVEKELKSLGFSVKRYEGANREETSLEVLEKVNSNEVFVVGADGEADAMSIAPVAASKGQAIVVAKNGGISEDALEALEGKKVTVIGGESVVSASEYEAIKDVASATQRISGSNRKATNAAIINKYYKKTPLGTKEVVVAKDGQKNKSELIDALTATVLASKNNAPIVLATDKLSNDQINAIELNNTNTNDTALYQVGYGVNRNVVLTLAQRLGLAK